MIFVRTILLLLLFASTAFGLPCPEDFGADGDDKLDDHAALVQFFNTNWQVEDINESVALELSPGKTYYYSEPITVTCGSTKNNFKLILYGNGSRLVYRGGPDKGYAFRFGDLGNNKKGFFCRVEAVSFEVDNKGADGNLLIDNCDFSHWDTIRAVGATTGAAIKVGNANSLTFTNVNAGGSKYGFLVDGVCNVLNWTGGKVLNCEVGISYKGTVFLFEGLDCSLCSDAAIVLDRAGKGEIRLYTERLGPKTRGNAAACVRMRNSTNIRIAGSLNCANGNYRDGTHAGYGVHCTACEDILVEAGGYCPQRAFVWADEDCVNIIVNARVYGPDPPHFTTAQPVDMPDSIRLKNLLATHLPDTGPPSVFAPLATWSSFLGASISGKTLTLPNIGGSQLRSAAITVLPGKYRLETRLRLVDFHEADILKRKADLAVAYIQLRANNVPHLRYVRLGHGWQDVWVDANLPAGKLQGFLGVVSGMDAMTIEVDFLRVYKLN